MPLKLNTKHTIHLLFDTEFIYFLKYSNHDPPRKGIYQNRKKKEIRSTRTINTFNVRYSPQFFIPFVCVCVCFNFELYLSHLFRTYNYIVGGWGVYLCGVIVEKDECIC